MRAATITASVLLGVVAVGLAVGCSATAKTSAAASVHNGVSFKGQPSVDVLIDRFVAGVSANDAATLNTLRVSEDEYRRIIIPGSVPQGKTPVYVQDPSNLFFWQMLNQKSHDYLEVVLSDFGGRPLKRGDVTYTENPRQYAWYRAYGEVRIPVNDGNGPGRTLKSGWIAEVDGQYKFIGFNWDD